MKYIIAIMLPLVLFAACKKKTTPSPYFMTLYKNGDSLWTKSDITAVKEANGSVTLVGKNGDVFEKITLILADYRPGKKVYTIGTTTGVATTRTAATYDYSGFSAPGNSGQISIDNFGNNRMEGTFDIYKVSNDTTGFSNVHYAGSFTAPIP